MISIRKYLNGDTRTESEKPEAISNYAENLCRFSSATLDCLNQHIFIGDANEIQRTEITRIRDSLRPDLKITQGAQASADVSAVLAAYRASLKKSSVAQVMETQNIFALLNQALVSLAEGSDRGVSRLSTIQESIQRASSMRDMSSLRNSLSETVQFIQKEAVEARESAAKELGKFETEVGSAREFLGATRLELAGRPEGMSEIAGSLKSLGAGDALYCVAYMCERLNAVTQRYGPAVAEELISRLIKERLRPVMPGNTLYRWTPSSLVAVFSRPRNAEKVRKEVADLNKTPLVHKIALGGRTAVLTISPSHLVAESNSTLPEVLVEQVDKFTLG